MEVTCEKKDEKKVLEILKDFELVFSGKGFLLLQKNHFSPKNVQKIFESQPNPLALVDVKKEKMLLWANKAFFKTFAYKNLEDFYKKNACLCSIFKTKQKTKINNSDRFLEKLLKNGNKSLKAEIEVNGKNQFFLIKCKKIEKNTFAIHFTEITKLEKELQEKTKELQEYFDAINEFALVSKTDLRGKITYANKKFSNVNGYKKSELMGQDHKIIRHPDTPKAIYKKMWETIFHKKTFKGEIKNRRKDGSSYFIQTMIKPILDSKNKIKEFISIRADVTEIVETREKLKKSNQKLKELSKIKDEFLSIASHELRTPMGIVKSYASMLMDGNFGKVNKKQKTFIEKIYRNASGLISLVNDMLDIKKIEEGKMSFEIEEIKIENFTEKVVKDFEIILKEKKISLEIKNLESKDFFVIVDEEKLGRIFVNLLNNAIKFSKENGKIEILLAKKGKKATIQVKDNGIGIDKRKQKKIFEKFSQAHRESQNKGTGLGLAIVKNLVEKMGGQISLESKVGKGSNFIFTLPTKN